MTKKLSTNGIRFRTIKPSTKEYDIDDDSKVIKELMKYLVGFEKSNKYCKEFSSYGLKHIFENFLKKVTNREITYVSNGEFIRAMEILGFEWKECNDKSPNAIFKITKKSLAPYGEYFGSC